MRLTLSAIVLLGSLSLAGCGSEGGHGPGDAARGQQLFVSEALGSNGSGFSCLSCHSVTPGEPSSIGPNLSDVGVRAASVVPGKSAEQYLHEAIVDPDAYLADGYQEGIHPRDYRRTLTSSQISDLVAYLLTLRSSVK